MFEFGTIPVNLALKILFSLHRAMYRLRGNRQAHSGRKDKDYGWSA